MTLDEFKDGYARGWRRVVLPLIDGEPLQERGAVLDDIDMPTSEDDVFEVQVDDHFIFGDDDGLRSISVDQIQWEV